ncbi:MAG: PTS sugar transporter subunit IIA, partial [Atopostipes sp.]|nr:PTS sugar transporter subunit IIA [Atopostipes sp.]
ETAETYDIIFSTVYIDTDSPFFLVPVILDAEDKNELYSLVYEEVPILTIKPSPIDKIINATKKYSSIVDETSLRIELTEILYENSNKNTRKGDSPLLHELITRESFKHTTEKLDWKEAINKAAKPLLEENYINKNYINRMIENVEEYGPFINLGKGVAIPHARPEDGVNELSMAMLVLDESIYLPEDDRAINILIVIAAIDNETHLTALSHLTNILTSDESVKMLTNATKYDDIIEIIHQGGEE